MDNTTLWITGATGFVGGHFCYWALKHSDAEVVAIVRSHESQTGQERLLDALEEIAASYRDPFDRNAALARLRVVHGDITMGNCGVDPAISAAPDRHHEFWHMAASLQFEDRYRDRIRLINVDGTRHALGLAERLGISRFVHVSTAYSCGKCNGDVPERLHDLAREFNNVYERTKCEAEHEVARWSERTGSAVAIVRPSIVVGPKATHAPGGSDTGLYGFAREIHRLRRMVKASGRSLVMCGDGEAPINLIAVDDVVREMWRLHESGFAGGLVHHVTSDEHPDVARLLELVGEHCGVGPVLTVHKRTVDPSPVEQVIDRRAQFYASYLRDAKRFARRAGPRMSVSSDDLRHYLRAYLNELRGESLDSIFRRAIVKTADGELLVSHSAGPVDAPSFVLCNAYGVPSDVWMPLVRSLAREFRLVTWELRASEDEELSDLDPEVHVSDMRRVMNHHGVTQAHLVGWCTGVDLALRFAELYPARVHGVIGVGGALNGAGAQETPFQRDLRKLVDKAAAHLAHAELYHQILFGGPPLRAVEEGSSVTSGEKRKMLASMLDVLDPALLHMTSAPFREPRALHRYARTMRGHYAHAQRNGLPRPHADVLFIVGSRDEVAHPDASRKAAQALPNARLIELPEGDHFALYTDPQVAEMVREFARSPEHMPTLGVVAA